ncbi:MAG: hypothetical protein R3190_03800 [Thermoanaerobaculia bacterium]|nr:hypothetical protein [Thermoanaerobaculia bacterium]
MIAPRVGLAWDLRGNGRSKLFANFGRYYESIPLSLNTRAWGSDRSALYVFSYPASGSLPTAHDPGTLLWSFSSRSGIPVASGIEPPYVDELLLGYQFGVGRRTVVGAHYVSRSIGDVLENLSFDGASLLLGNPGGAIPTEQGTGPGSAGAARFPTPVRNYRALQLSFERRLHAGWQLGGSYVYSRSEGNYVGLYRAESYRQEPHLTNAFDLADLTDLARGPLPNDRPHQLKLYGAYDWDFGLRAGFFAQHLDGTPVSKLGAHPRYGPGARYVVPRGTAGRTPDLTTLDLHLEAPIRVGAGKELVLFLDVFNATDEQVAIVVDENWSYAFGSSDGVAECGGPGTGPGTSCPDGNPAWGAPLRFHQPRAMRLGARWSW